MKGLNIAMVSYLHQLAEKQRQLEVQMCSHMHVTMTGCGPVVDPRSHTTTHRHVTLWLVAICLDPRLQGLKWTRTRTE